MLLQEIYKQTTFLESLHDILNILPRIVVKQLSA